ncbi:MAG: hypothetical protein CMJ19_15345 [Phycisphaeraceae bacterium]|nr:hypothetical protein [Phycisphaeraceae bacterium]
MSTLVKTFYMSGLFLLLLALSLLPGCGKSDSDSQDTASRKKQIAVIAKSTVNAYWKAVEQGAKKAADEADIQIIWTGPDAETNHTQQASMVDNMVNRGVDGIVLAPTNFEALVRPVESAAMRDVPIVIIDSPVNSDKPVSVVATDNASAGGEAARALIEAMGDKRPNGGKVIMLRFLEGSASTEQREKGFNDVINAAGSLSVVESAYIKGSGSTTDAADTADALLRRHIKDNELKVDGIFASNQPTAIGMLRKLDQFRQQGITINAPFVGFDAHDVLLKGIRDGKIAALVVQDPLNMGYLGVKTMIDQLDGKKVDAFVNTGATRVTAENVDKPEIKKITLED